MSLAVSAIIPTYNRVDLISRAIESAIAALGAGDEIIVVDDGSTDGTQAVVEAFGPPVRLLQVAHGGAGAARNAGVEAATGPLLAFLDSDDEWQPDKITLQRALLESRPDLLFVFSNFGVRLEDGSEEHDSLRWWLRKPQPLEEIFGESIPYTSMAPLPDGRADFPVYIGSFYLEEMQNNIIPAFTLMVRKAGAAGALGFATDLPTCEEWPAFGQLTRRGEGALLDTETAWQHSHSGVRLTQLPAYAWASAWLSSLERIWGSDPAFLAEHEAAYHETVQEAHLMRGVSLIRHGKPLEGAREMRHAGPGAWRSFWYGTASKHTIWVMHAAWGWLQGLFVWFQS